MHFPFPQTLDNFLINILAMIYITGLQLDKGEMYTQSFTLKYKSMFF